MPKLLFTGVHRPKRSPSQRYRFEQFETYLKNEGFEIEYSYIIDKETDKFIYQPGNYFKKGVFYIFSIVKMYIETFKFNSYDYIFIQREALMGSFYFYERKAAKSKAKLIYDFDDAIWLQHVSEGNKNLAFLKNPEKIKKIIEVSDLVLAGNQFLTEYAKTYNSNSVLFPTVVDTDKYTKIEKTSNNYICIGWSGSFSTFEHFELILPVLKKLKTEFGDQIKLKVIGAPYKNLDVDIEFVNWSEETEIKNLNDFDIGIMPLEQNIWNEGKCGLKALLYMSMGIPSVVSPVGVNKSIITPEENGYWASTELEWYENLKKLILDKELREKLGSQARKKVILNYSVSSHRKILVELFKNLRKK
ncbi:MAG: glycosyltransferase family 4 protein [Cytophagales bacterium]